MAKKEIKTSIRIEATAAQVWDILMDFSKYEQWNPFISSLEGNVKVGEKIAVNAGGMNFKPTVLSRVENRQLSWIGRLLCKGVFDGEHVFRIADNADGSITFFHEEYFSGLLVGPFAKKLDRETRPGFEAMNQALKQRAETRQ